MAVVFPPGEEERINALLSLELLDSPAEACFDRITQLVADSLGLPVALISFVDRHRQWFKSRVGIELTEASRDRAFCARTILSDDPFIVPDATEHPDFALSELVCGEVGVRFYAGVPLCAAPGIRIGALCVMDRKPRPALTPDQLQLLQNLARIVEEFIKMRLSAQRLQQTESALRSAEQSYRSLVENSPIGIYRVKWSGELLLANPAAVKMLGFASISELLVMGFDRSQLAPNRPLIRELLERDGAITNREETWHKRDGAAIRIRESARLCRDEHGTPLYYEGTIEDITEQYSAGQRVREQEQRWELALRANNDGIWECNWDTNQRWFSDRYAHILGYQPGEVDGDWEARIHPEDREQVRSCMAAHLRGETDRYEAEYRIRCRDGGYKWVLSRGKASLEPNAAFRRMIGSLTDITSRKLDEELVRAAEERYRQLFRHNPLPILVCDRESLRMLAVNDAAERAYGYRRDELLGRSAIDLLEPGLRDKTGRQLRALQSFPHRTSPFAQRTKDGRTLLAEATIHQIEFDQQPAYIAIINDVTEITRAQAKLEDAVKQAEEASRSKSHFLATMSHEIRTPMNGVIGMTNLLLNTSLTPEQRDFVETIRASGEVLLNVINDVLDFSKIESGRLNFEKVSVNLQNIVGEAVGLTAPAANSKRLPIQVHISPEVPASVITDPSRLCQVLLNLLSNAIKFTQQGQIAIALTVESSNAETVRVRFTVRDTGIGIEPEKLPILFEPFTQADVSTTRRFGGTGLGLAISKSLVELMGGQIGCQSTPGVGSTFWFVLPLPRSVTETKPELRSPHLPQQPRPETPPPSMRVLVAEDNPVNQKVVVHLLRRMGYTADVVPNGRKAVDAYRLFPYKVILMDSQMPEMDGFEATRLIRQMEDGDHRSIIISITANALEGDRERSLAAGMDDYISKPVNAAVFEEKLTRWANRAAAEDAAVAPAPALVNY